MQAGPRAVLARVCRRRRRRAALGGWVRRVARPTMMRCRLDSPAAAAAAAAVTRRTENLFKIVV